MCPAICSFGQSSPTEINAQLSHDNLNSNASLEKTGVKKAFEAILEYIFSSLIFKEPIRILQNDIYLLTTQFWIFFSPFTVSLMIYCRADLGSSVGGHLFESK